MTSTHKLFLYKCLFVVGIIIGAAGCFGKRGLYEIKERPYPVLHEDDSTVRLGSKDDNVFIEIRSVAANKPMENLAIYYPALFPGGEIIRPGDREEYVKVNGHNAYKVVFQTKYIRKRKRITGSEKEAKKSLPNGWTIMTMEDPLTGKPIPVMYGPIIPQQKILYVVQGTSRIYYVLLRADGDAIDAAVKTFDKLVKEGIDYQ